MIPPTVTHQQKGVRVVGGKPVFYEKANVKAARFQLAQAIWPHRPEQPLEGAIDLSVVWKFPCGDSHPDGAYRITRPDTDNLQKLLKDVMTDLGFWKDDAQVCRDLCTKLWSSKPGILICASELEDETK